LPQLKGGTPFPGVPPFFLLSFPLILAVNLLSHLGRDAKHPVCMAGIKTR